MFADLANLQSLDSKAKGRLKAELEIVDATLAELEAAGVDLSLIHI